MNEREYRRLIQQLEADFQKKREAIELVWLMARDTNHDASPRAQGNGGGNGTRSGTLAAAVEDVITRFITETVQFNLNTVIELIEANHPEIKKPINPTSVSGCLKNLAKDKPTFLVLAQRGSGKRPNLYQKVQGNLFQQAQVDENDQYAGITEDDIPF
jgi:hypothetical protein